MKNDLNVPIIYYRRARGDMVETWKSLHGQSRVSQIPLQRDTNTNTFNNAEKGEVFQPSAKKRIQTSRDKPLEHANRKYCNLTIHNIFKRRGCIMQYILALKIARKGPTTICFMHIHMGQSRTIICLSRTKRRR